MEVEVLKNPDGTWRVTNVPLISTGIEYPLASGPATFTESQLVDAVAAMKDDPAIVEPRIKLGHSSGYNDALIGDAEQAFGRIDASTVVIGDNGQTIYGDYTGLPEWLAKVVAIAYPNRSIEGNFDVETVTGRNYELVITAVSLLGIYWPGCQVLEDLPTWYGAETPDGVEFSDDVAAQVKAGGSMKPEILADADTSRVRRQFYDAAMAGEIDAPEGTNTYWWWIRAERLADSGGMYLIVEDEDNGNLYRVDVSLSDDTVAFGTGVPVTVQYPEKTTAARAAVVAGMAVVESAMVVHASRADTGGPEPQTQKGASTNMDEAKRKTLAAALGLPEDATEEQIKAKHRAIAAAADDAGLETTPADGEAAGKTGSEVTPEEQPPAHQTPPGTAPSGTAPGGVPEESPEDIEAGVVRVDKATWERTQSDAALARQHENERVSARQKTKVDDAIRAGKFPVARREHYTKLMAADEKGTTDLIESLQAGAIPVGAEVGRLGDGDEGTVSATQSAGLPDEWFPEIAAKRESAGRHQPVTIAKEG